MIIGFNPRAIVRAVKEEPTMAKWPADHMTCLNRYFGLTP